MVAKPLWHPYRSLGGLLTLKRRYHRMPIPWDAQQQDAELIRELAEYDIGIAAVGLGQSQLHLHRQL